MSHKRGYCKIAPGEKKRYNPMDQARKEEINCMRLLACCEFKLREDGFRVQTLDNRRKLMAYLKVLTQKVETLRKYRAEKVPLRYSNKLDYISSRTSSMQRRLITRREVDEAQSSSETRDRILQKYLQVTPESSSIPSNPAKVFLRCSSVPGLKVEDRKEVEKNIGFPGEEKLSQGSSIEELPSAQLGQLTSGTYDPIANESENRRRRMRRRRARKGMGGSLRGRMSATNRLEEEKMQQEELQREILDLTEELKRLQIEVSNFFSQDRKTLDAVTQKMGDNLARTQSEKARLDEYNKRSSEICRDW
eukprot:CAMPEP_0184478392 /NCGR_PEP_ID=MMETSP0113_2-20130426/437_1 /TAXON_ID=91329 /ORGANISM="Norrisiella sphaerica, Strain BC52" /LENGTH=305 /DNA_ID=CAMNT_0026856167 /DNA_START=42 /DNA_END=957 /DNA_ORIENTATION=-